MTALVVTVDQLCAHLRSGGYVLVRGAAGFGPLAGLVLAADRVDSAALGRLSQLGSGPLRLALAPGEDRSLDLPKKLTTAGGCLRRPGLDEAAVDLMHQAGLSPAAVVCDLDDRVDVDAFSDAHDLPILSVDSLVTHRLSTEVLVEQVASARLPMALVAGDFRIRAFRSQIDGSEQVAITLGDLTGEQGQGALVRVHSECLTGDAFGSLRCDCGPQLRAALVRIAEAGTGAVVYVRGHEGRGIGIANKVRAYALQDAGYDTVDANSALGLVVDGRDYAGAAQIIRALGARDIHLMTNNPDKLAELQRYGIRVKARVPLEIASNPFNAEYLATKRARFGHTLECGVAP